MLRQERVSGSEVQVSVKVEGIERTPSQAIGFTGHGQFCFGDPVYEGIFNSTACIGNVAFVTLMHWIFCCFSVMYSYLRSDCR